MRREKKLDFSKRVLLSITFVTLKQRYEKACIVLCRDWKTALTLLFFTCIYLSIHVFTINSY